MGPLILFSMGISALLFPALSLAYRDDKGLVWMAVIGVLLGIALWLGAHATADCGCLRLVFFLGSYARAQQPERFGTSYVPILRKGLRLLCSQWKRRDTLDGISQNSRAS